MTVYDFDSPTPDRRHSGSYKWDSAADDDIIPLWVADMDFRTAPPVIDALRRLVEHGVFGYVRVPDEYYDALCHWFGERYGWAIDRRRVIYTSGVVPAISAVIKALCPAGSGVIVQTPVYNCFFSSIRNNGCRVTENPLLRKDSAGGFTYAMDFDGLETLASDPANRLMLLCNPHNPAGRCWSADELRRVVEICAKYDMPVVSDEIHCDLTMPGLTYTPLAKVAGGSNYVVCNSPSKSFNTAGLQIANIISAYPETQAAIDRAININEVCDVNPFGVAGLIAAYSEGAEWLDRLREYIAGNYRFLKEYLAGELPMLPVAELEATYLAWVDISPLERKGTEIEELLKDRHGVWINAGGMYGCDDYVRINLACPRSRLREGLCRMCNGLKQML